MTDYKKYINALRKCAKEHENDRTLTGQIIVSNLCEAIADLLEGLSDSENLNKSEIPTGSNTKDDLALIHTWGLDEEIRCIMCTNHMKSDRGCDGSCAVNKDMYNAVMDAIEKRIQSTESEPKDSGNELTNPFGDSRFGG